MMKKESNIGQTIIELAVFGAILMFVIGLIVQQGLGAAHQQNNALKAMRMALSLSYQFSEGIGEEFNREFDQYEKTNPTYSSGGKRISKDDLKKIRSHGAASRNSAAVLFVEDRLTAASNKYGSTERIPLIINGAGIHSRNLMLSIDTGESFHLPVYDLFINGKHFPFRMAGFKRVCLGETRHAGCDEWIGDKAVQKSQWWDSSCTTRYDEELGIAVPVGCAKLYTSLPNHPAIVDFCAENCPIHNLTADQRFDLDRDGKPDVPIKGPDNWFRKNFSWQWMMVNAFDESVGRRVKMATSYPPGDAVGSVVGSVVESSKVKIVDNGIEKTDDSAKNLSVDVDMDLKEEQIVEISKTVLDDPNSVRGVVTEVVVQDFQEGDLDFTINDFDLQDPTVKEPGLKNELEMYTKTKEGTYLRIEEGSLFTIDNEGRKHQLVRSVQRRDSVDLIARKIQLSKNTGRFCIGNNIPPPAYVDGFPNPVDVCSDECYKKENFEKTCYNSDPRVNAIIVRSNIFAGQGKKWIVDLFGDEEVEFEVPKIK